MNEEQIRIFSIIEFKSSIQLHLRKTITLEFEEKYSREKFVEWEHYCKTKVLDIEILFEQLLYTQLRQLQKNPTRDLAIVVIDKWSMISYTSDIVQKSAFQYLCVRLNHPSINLGHTDAYTTLYQRWRTLNNRHPKNKENQYEWLHTQERLEQLYYKLLQSTFIGPETSLDVFKTTLNGGILTDIKPIKLHMSNTLIVYLFDELDNKGFLKYQSNKNNICIESITGINNVAQSRDNTHNSKSGKPKGFEKIDEILNSI